MFAGLELYHLQLKWYSLIDFVFKSYPFFLRLLSRHHILYIPFYSHIFIPAIVKYTGRVIEYVLEKKKVKKNIVNITLKKEIYLNCTVLSKPNMKMYLQFVDMCTFLI